MSSFLGFHAFAAARGEGLRPELSALLERAATEPYRQFTSRKDGMLQSGPDPISAAAPLAQAVPVSSRTAALHEIPGSLGASGPDTLRFK